MPYKPVNGAVELEVKDDIAYMTLNRPEKGNTINTAMEDDLVQCWLEVNNNLPIRAVIITGKGRDFCSGVDEKEFTEGEHADDLQNIDVHNNFRVPLPDRAHSRPAKPMIVAVNGACSGKGLRFIATADIVICSDDAVFYDPRPNLSLAPIQEILALTRLKSAPKGIAMRMAAMGENYKIDARRALEFGMVTEVVPKDRLLARATELANYIKEASPAATRAAVAGFWDVFTCAPLDKGRWYAQMYSQQARHMDGKEGALAWLEGRAPVWPSLTSWSPPWTPIRISFVGRQTDVGTDVKEVRTPGTPG